MRSSAIVAAVCLISLSPMLVACGTEVASLDDSPSSLSPGRGPDSRTDGQGGDSLPEDSGSPSGTVPTDLDLVSLLEEVVYSEADHAAIERSVGECMRELSLSYEPSPYYPLDIVDDERYGFRSVADAESFGYGEANDEHITNPDNPENSGLVGLSESDRSNWFLNLLGDGSQYETVDLSDGASISVPTNGCLATSTMAFDPQRVEREAISTAIQLLLIDATAHAATDSRVIDLESEWSACMRGRGYEVPNRESAREVYFGDRSDTAIAIADADCLSETNYGSELRQIDAEIQSKVVNDNRLLILAALELASG